MASPPRSPRFADPMDGVPRRSPRPASSLGFEYAQTIVHTGVSNDNTPRLGREEQFELPIEFLAAETGSSSFSFAATKEKGMADVEKPEITSLDLSASPNGYVLMGDSNGRVALYAPPPSQLKSEPVRQRIARFWHQAFSREFDVLRSVEVEERVTKAVLLPRRSSSVTSYMVANARNIKMYRMRENLRRPKSKTVVPVCSFTGPHVQAPIHSLSLCSDEQTFLSADDFQVQWWHIDASESTKPFCLLDIHPEDMSNVSQLLTAASFHPTHGSLFLVSSSDGWTKVGDLRDPPSRRPRKFAHTMTTLPQHNLVQHGHDDILCSVADAAFLQNSFIATRDYLSIKIWDTRNANEPVNCLPVHECLAAHIDELYDSDAVFDRFGLAIDQHTGTIVSGMYDGQVVIWQPESAQPPLYIRGHFDDSSIGTAGPLSWSEDPAYYANRVTNVGISDGGATVAFSSHDKLFVFDRVRAGRS
jgi:WD40 repeat protein